jgi:hypothetical protein
MSTAETAFLALVLAGFVIFSVTLFYGSLTDG